MYAVMCGLYVDYKRSAVGYTCAMWKAYFSGAYANIRKLCILVLLVTLLVAVSLYEVHVLTQLSHMCTYSNWHIWHSRGILSGTSMAVAQ